MLRDSADMLWPKMHRGIVKRANNCQQCRMADKNLKFGKLLIAEKQKEQSLLGFAVLFQNATKGNNNMLVSVYL